jgi:hypothetical protein
VPGDAGDIDQDVHPAEGGDGLGDQRNAVLLATDIRLHHDAAVTASGEGLLDVTQAVFNTSARATETPTDASPRRCGATDPARCAGHDGGLAAEIEEMVCVNESIRHS